MLDFFQERPTELRLLALVVISIVPTAIGLLIVRWLRPAAELRREHDVVGYTFSVVSVIYGVLAIFTLVPQALSLRSRECCASGALLSGPSLQLALTHSRARLYSASE